jgi:DNA (cytosine-5)-methyltransferase 1
MPDEITFADLFAGIGGFRLGIERAAKKLNIPVKCVFSSEIEKNAVKVYEKNFKETPFGDIKKIQAGDITNVDILCGGFPCQDVSTAGKRIGLCGSRTGLFFEVIRIAREKEPNVIFLENVAGLLTSNSGWDFARIIVEMESIGYEVEAELLDSRDFGVPQKRARLYIIGRFGERRSKRKIFPIERKTGKNNRNGETISPRYTSTAPIKFLNRNTNSYPVNYALTLDVADSSGVIDNKRIRRFTAEERERLQGYPVGWTDGVSFEARKKLLGNAVTVPVIEAIATKILQVFTDAP